MINDYYINNYVTYTKSGSMSSDGTYVFSGSVDLTGKCRIEPLTDVEGESTHKIFIGVISLDHVDTIYVDGNPYEIKGINEFQNNITGHHLELEVYAT